jgi:hypothetical protein
MSDQVVYATSDVTLHSVQGSEEVNGNTVYNVEAVTLSVGGSVDLDSLPPYQQEAVKSGKVPGVEVVSREQADKMSAERAAFLKSIGAGAPDINFQTVGLTGPDADDGSFSDHLVPDEERRENLAARAAAESGDSGPKESKKDAPKSDSVKSDK